MTDRNLGEINPSEYHLREWGVTSADSGRILYRHIFYAHGNDLYMLNITTPDLIVEIEVPQEESEGPELLVFPDISDLEKIRRKLRSVPFESLLPYLEDSGEYLEHEH